MMLTMFQITVLFAITVFNMDLRELVSFDQGTKDYIKSNEGYDDTIYKDTKNIPTTGYGFNMKAEHVRRYIPADVLRGKRALTKPESEAIFDKVYMQAVKDARQFVGDETFQKLPNNAKQVIIDMSYNMGLTRLNKFENMKKALQSGDISTASKEMMDSDYARKDVPSRAKKNLGILMPAQDGQVEKLASDNISARGMAFREARKKGLKTFMFDGKEYTTEVK